ncbi:MAG: hypothetical protein EAZ47_04135 [Bacteroidetes bacterium]|nr:MAG: hypothetical protein EAZ47_04135 [Bacteroidota bacterium]
MWYQKVVAVVLFSFVGWAVNAQYKSSTFEVGVQAGTLLYQGDLTFNPMGSYEYIKPSWTVYALKEVDNQLSFRLQFSRGNFAENEVAYRWVNPTWKQERGLQVQTKVSELSALAMYYPLGRNTVDGARKINPYIMGGLGMAFTSVNRNAAAFDTSFWGGKSAVAEGLAADLAKPTPKLVPVLPVGIGLQYALGNNWVLRGEALYRFTGSDYLDGFSKVANAASKDAYYTVQLGIGYRFGKNAYRCPRVQ